MERPHPCELTCDTYRKEIKNCLWSGLARDAYRNCDLTSDIYRKNCLWSGLTRETYRKCDLTSDTYRKNYLLSGLTVRDKSRVTPTARKYGAASPMTPIASATSRVTPTARILWSGLTRDTYR